MTLPGRVPDPRIRRAVFALGVFAGAAMTAAAILRQLVPH